MPRLTPIDWRKLEKVFMAAEFQFVRQEGRPRSHANAGVARPVLIPTYREVPECIIPINLKTASLPREDYFEVLQQGK